MTPEEMTALIEQQKQTITDLEAERNSLRDENKTRLETLKKTEEELKKTKELNFTLARTIDAGKGSRPLEAVMSEAFK